MPCRALPASVPFNRPDSRWASDEPNRTGYFLQALAAPEQLNPLQVILIGASVCLAVPAHFAALSVTALLAIQRAMPSVAPMPLPRIMAQEAALAVEVETANPATANATRPVAVISFDMEDLTELDRGWR